MAQATTDAAVAPPPPPEEEEFWPTPSLLTGHTIHTIRFGGKEPRVLRYKSMASDELTPLDMIYGNQDSSNDDCTNYDENNDEFYDGTGNLMWMAAICFGHLLAQEVEPLRSYLWHGSPVPPMTGRTTPNRNRRFCELGCGTGGGGISLLLCAPPETDPYVVFTDNDAQSLELCASNCELNGLDPDSYSQKLLGWGSEHLETWIEIATHSFDVVFATDVIYDLKMIAPLFQTVDGLLKKKQPQEHSVSGKEEGGILVLSHVPRFCIPNESSDGEDQDDNIDDDDDSPGTAFLKLEQFIETEASKVGLVLTETIRPHRVLSEEELGGCDEGSSEDNDEDSMQQLTLETMRDAHAVVFVYRRS